MSYPPPPSHYPPPPPPPLPPPYLAGPPAPKRGGNTALIVILIVGFLLLVCCVAGGYAGWRAWSGVSTAVEDFEEEIGKLTASPFPDLDSDTQAPPLSGPKDAFHAKVGDCLADDPSDEYPDQQAIVACSAAGATKIVKRYDGVFEKSLCPSDQDWYYENFKGTSRDFVVCMVAP